VYLHPSHNRASQLYSQAPGSLFVASYDSQGYSRGILTHLHSGPRVNNSREEEEEEEEREVGSSERHYG
jgi:hypothetical protein